MLLVPPWPPAFGPLLRSLFADDQRPLVLGAVCGRPESASKARVELDGVAGVEAVGCTTEVEGFSLGIGLGSPYHPGMSGKGQPNWVWSSDLQRRHIGPGQRAASWLIYALPIVKPGDEAVSGTCDFSRRYF